MTLEQQLMLIMHPFLSRLRCLRPIFKWLTCNPIVVLDLETKQLVPDTSLVWVSSALADGLPIGIAINEDTGRYQFSLTYTIPGEALPPSWRPSAIFTDRASYLRVCYERTCSGFFDPARRPPVPITWPAKELSGTRRHPRFVRVAA